MFKNISLAITALFFVAATLPSQMIAPTPTVPTAPVTIKLGPGEEMTDGTVTFKNTDTKGHMKVTCSGKRKKVDNKWTVGDCGDVNIPASQGTRKFEVETGGEEVNITINRNGTSADKVEGKISGGNAKVKGNGNHSKGTIGGTGNTLDMNGNDQSWKGADNKSGGDVTNKGRRNNFSSNGGNWNYK